MRDIRIGMRANNRAFGSATLALSAVDFVERVSGHAALVTQRLWKLLTND